MQPFVGKQTQGEEEMKIEVEREAIELFTQLNCDHVITTGDKDQHCDKKDGERGACCNSCWTRRWAESVLSNNLIRKYLGYSAMGSPVTLPKE